MPQFPISPNLLLRVKMFAGDKLNENLIKYKNGNWLVTLDDMAIMKMSYNSYMARNRRRTLNEIAKELAAELSVVGRC